MLDRRKDARTTTHKRGFIKFGASELACTVEDLTSAGAGLHVGTTFGVPRVFQLAIDGEPTARHCKVMWTDGKRFGVLFE